MSIRLSFTPERLAEFNVKATCSGRIFSYIQPVEYDFVVFERRVITIINFVCKGLLHRVSNNGFFTPNCKCIQLPNRKRPSEKIKRCYKFDKIN